MAKVNANCAQLRAAVGVSAVGCIAVIAVLLTRDLGALSGLVRGAPQGGGKEVLLQILKYKRNLPDRNPFIGFDSAFKQGPFKKVEAEKNVFSDFEQGYKAPRFHQLKQDHSPLEDDMPQNYPFNEAAGGHEWKTWVGDSPMQALREKNALDMGTSDAAFQIGEHSLGRPFREYKPEKNVFESLSDGESHIWGRTKDSIPDKNVFDSLSPDSGYPDE